MISPFIHLEELLDTWEEEAARLPRPWAYLLIFLISGVLWSAIAFITINLLKWLA
jgi:hypothetical protein